MKSIQIAFETEELRLVPLTLDQLENFNENPEKIALELEVRDHKLFNPEPLQRLNTHVLLPRLRNALPNDEIYCTRWLAISKVMNKVVADFIIKKLPDSNGEIEIGHGVYPKYEGKGWMTKVVAAFMLWAQQQPRIKTVMAETAKKNLSSIRVLQKNDFKLSRETDKFYYWRCCLNTRETTYTKTNISHFP
ncbi:GNAT family N-acetyltransferase [Pontibacter sp. H249]|uniref:GNAT family N-acetyltransferase n=1 Tax=Pontibacter sp. H249 TaxID=3133420 RepID=UPI0030C5C371